MFDQLVAEAAGARGGAGVGAWARVEAAACARRLAGMVAMLDARHAADGSAEREQWYLDNWGAVSAEIGAAQRLTPGAASHQLLIATALRDRLPQVAAVFAQGLVSYAVVSVITSRTMAIKDPDALAGVDAALAAAAVAWEPMSAAKTVTAIDYWIDRYDPHAVRRLQNVARSRSVQVCLEDSGGLASLWGALFGHDAKALDQRLDALAATVCEADPRTLDQRRADALGALAHGADHLGCLCGLSDCDAAAPTRGSGSAVVYVITHADTLTETSAAATSQDGALDGVAPRPLLDKPLRELTLAQALADPDPGEPAATRPGVMLGGPLLAGPLIRRIALQAAIRRIIHPGASPPEPRYAPSRALADFVGCRDLTCRFPGCDVPADRCDLDHTIAYPAGPTCASNLKCLCRLHHLLKTFWSGDGGWRDRQLPDGTVIWSAPGGQTYRTQPGSHLLFPSLCDPTAPVTVAASSSRPAGANAGLTMPRRRATRTEDRRRRVDEERRLNEQAALLRMADSSPPF